jgi:ankyrin repeat protein
LAPTPVDQFLQAITAGDVERVRALLDMHVEVREAVNAPTGDFGSRPIAHAKKNLPLFDLLMSYGADPNLKSEWAPGGFGLLEVDCTPEDAAPLIARGVTVDVFAAAHLGMFDRVTALVEGDPSLVQARGGDGKTALHCATTVEIAEYLLNHGADIDARDVDHESTPAQYLVREAPAVTRLLIERGAWVDIFMAVGLGDAALVERCLRDDPEALEHRTWHGRYRIGRDDHGAPAHARSDAGRGDIYRWVFDHNVSALDVAASLGNDAILQLLLRHASPVQCLLAACARADRAAAEAVVTQHPEIVASLSPDEQRLIVDRAHANHDRAVALMVDLGFDPLAHSVDGWEAFRWAAFHGNLAMLKRLLPYNPPIGVRDPSYGGTPLGQCLYGSLHGWQRGDFAACVQVLLDAGERITPDRVPIGREDVDAVLRAHLAKS